MTITDNSIAEFEQQLITAERERATVSQYIRAVRRLRDWLGGREADKVLLLEYKEKLKFEYATASVNAMLTALNGFFDYFKQYELKLRLLKHQRKIFSSPESELSREEYQRLSDTAKRAGKTRLFYILKTIFMTGIRISELKYITVETVKRGSAEISCKGKYRAVILPESLCKALAGYAKERGIESGSIFITRGGNPVDRSNIAKEMKRLAELANVLKKKVFPHNFRHLFARTYYSRFKDIVRLADILGHSSINTTRIYTAESGAVHRRQLGEIFQI